MRKVYLCFGFLILLLGNVPLIIQDTFAQTKSNVPLKWSRLPGLAVDVTINAEGQAYVLAPDGTPRRWGKVKQRWRRMSGRFVRISAAIGNRPWAVDGKGVVYRYNGLWWENKATKIADVAADVAGNVYIAKVNGTIEKWNALRSEWHPITGNARRLALGPSGKLWAITQSGKIRSFDRKSWKAIPGVARDIAVGADGTVVIADPEGRLRIWDDQKRSWALIPGVKNVTAVAVAPDGGPWAVDARQSIFATSLLISKAVVEKLPKNQARTAHAKKIKPHVARAAVLAAKTPIADAVTAAPIIAQPMTTRPPSKSPPSTPIETAGFIDPATVTTKQKITFINTRQSAASIAIGMEGSVFALDAGGGILRWSNVANAFNSFPGTLARIAVDPNGNPWGISSLGRVFRHTGTQWQQIHNATASDISIGADGTVIITNGDGRLLKLNDTMTRFDLISGNGVLIAVAPDGTPWTTRSDKTVQRCEIARCKLFSQKAKSIAIGSDGSVYVVSDTDRLMRLGKKDKTFKQVSTAPHVPSNVAVGPNGFPWVISSAKLALSSKFFERNESGDQKLAVSTKPATTGTGSTGVVVSTQVSGITFNKNMKFDTISNTVEAGKSAYIFVGNDDSIWIYTTAAIGKFEKYNVKKKIFELESTALATNFYPVVDADLTSNGDLWAVTIGDFTGVFRERNNQIYSVTVGGTGTAKKIVIAGDDTVYVVKGGTIYSKVSDSNTFKKFSNDTDVSEIAVGVAGDIWIIDANDVVQQWTGSKFENRPAGKTQTATEIGGGGNGTIYIVNSSIPYKWNGINTSFDKINNNTTTYLDIATDGRLWLSVDTVPTIKRAQE